MSNSAIKDVTQALQMLLLSQLGPISGSKAQVSLLPPGEKLPGGLGVNLYLYRIMESPFTKNEPWPGDKNTPPSALPALGLELSYLLTPFAPAPDPAAAPAGDDAHTMLGAAMLVLHENPILNRVHITGFDADNVLSPALLNSFEQIKIRLATTSLEELSKIWATINQPYRLSVAYDVSLVELTPTAAPPVSGAVVLTTGLTVIPWQAPHLDELTPASGALAHVDSSGVLVANPFTINGSGFSMPGQLPKVMIGGQESSLSSVPAPTDSALTVTLPVDLSAGPSEDVQVSLNGKASTSLTFTVTPWLSLLTPIRTTLDSTAGPPAQTLTLQGTGFTTGPSGVRFDGPGGTTSVTTFIGAVTDQRAIVTIPAGLQNGVYSVRVVLAGPGNNASNARTLEVIPLIQSVTAAVVTVSGKQVHRLTMNGARLNGSDLRVLIDNDSYQAGTNAAPTQVLFTLNRLLDAGPHNVAVVVDGSRSHDFILEVV
jgi:hypothetical protein